MASQLEAAVPPARPLPEAWPGRHLHLNFKCQLSSTEIIRYYVTVAVTYSEYRDED